MGSRLRELKRKSGKTRLDDDKIVDGKGRLSAGFHIIVSMLPYNRKVTATHRRWFADGSQAMTFNGNTLVPAPAMHQRFCNSTWKIEPRSTFPIVTMLSRHRRWL